MFTIDFDTKVLEKNMPDEARRLAFSTAQALNETAKAIQTAERVNLDQKFKIRKAGFMYRLIKITQFASAAQGIPFAEIAIDNTKARVLLSEFEEGGEKDPAKGKNVAVPITGAPARPDFSQSVSDDWTFTGLKFKRVDLTKRGKDAMSAKKKIGIGGRLTGDYYIWAGNNRTFILPQSKSEPLGGVFQRTGPGQDDIRLVYSFQSHPRLQKMLGFLDRAKAIYAKEFSGQFDRAYRKKR